MLDTPDNRALVNRGIAEAMGLRVAETLNDGAVVIDATNKPPYELDYTRDLNACYEVCEEMGIDFLRVIDDASSDTEYFKEDLRWLVALAVWEAVKATKGERDVPKV